MSRKVEKKMGKKKEKLLDEELRVVYLFSHFTALSLNIVCHFFMNVLLYCAKLTGKINILQARTGHLFKQN